MADNDTSKVICKCIQPVLVPIYTSTDTSIGETNILDAWFVHGTMMRGTMVHDTVVYGTRYRGA